MIGISKRLLILCEDEKSSKLYFESFKRDEKLKRQLSAVNIEVAHPKDHSPTGLVNEAKNKKKKAKRERNPYDEVWIVLDKDRHANLEQALITARDNQIRVALSVICFEYWVLLHFEKSKKVFTKCDDIIGYIKKEHFNDYDKSTNAYSILKNKVETAIENGIWLMNQNQNDIDRGVKICNLSTYTDIYILVRKLLKPRKIK
mgnify:CR=1 FL=1